MLFSTSRSQTRFVLLPPAKNSALFSVFHNVTTDAQRHDALLAEMQRFRGRIYCGDGAIQRHELTADGRHKLAIDEQSWHILSLDPNGQVCACIRYLEESRAAGFDDLWVRNAAVARSPQQAQFREAVEGEMGRARRLRLGFGEAGGWAVAERYRGTVEPLRTALAIFGLMELLGGCTGLATATFRHGSATILRRIGLRPLEVDGQALPPYYDPNYDCEMEVLRFDSRYPNPKYAEVVRELSASLAMAPVIRRENIRTTLQGVLRGLEIPIPETAPIANLAV
jgi:hypothetical protein